MPCLLRNIQLGAGKDIPIASAAVRICDKGDENLFASILDGINVEPIEPDQNDDVIPALIDPDEIESDIPLDSVMSEENDNDEDMGKNAYRIKSQ